MGKKTGLKYGFLNFRRIILWLSTVLFVLLVVLFNIIGWYLYYVVKNSKEDELGKRLIAIANLVSSYFENEALVLSLSEGDEQTDWYKNLRSYLLDVKNNNRLRTISIYDVNFQWMIGTDVNMKIGDYSSLLMIDEEEINRCIDEKIGTQSYLYSYEEVQYKRAYAPIKDFDGEVVAFVKVEADREYFVALIKLRNSLIFLGLICIAVIGVLVVIFYKLVNELIKAEESAELTSRFQSLSTMAAGVAHEIRNPLGIIRNTTELLKSELPSDTESYSYTESILEEVSRLNILIDQFLQLSKRDVSAKKECDINNLIKSTVSFVEYDFERSNIKISYTGTDESVRIKCDEKSIKQLLLNLFINAKQSMENGGLINVNLSKNKDNILINITDEGSGIKRGDINKIFNPFYSTKDSGVGLGLTICKNIVDSHNGTIKIFNNKNKGTTVIVSLPMKLSV